MATPMQIGLTVEHKDEKYKIINHEKPYANFARHYIIQSMETGEIKTVYRHQIFEIQPDSVSDLRPSVSEEDELMEQSQSDIDLLDVEIEENTAPPSVVNVKPRFKSAPSDETLDVIAKARTEVTTNRQTNWGVKLFQVWLAENSFNKEFETLDPVTLNTRLRVFYGSLQTKDGKDYSKSSLVGIRSAISRHMTSPPYNRKLSLMKDSEFMTSNHVFTGLIKMLKRNGKDVTIHKKAISEGDIQKLYTSGVFGLEDPVSLQNKVFWDIMLNFARRGQEGLDILTRQSYGKFQDDKGHSFYKMMYNESNKTHHGVDSRENYQETRMYANPANPDNCPVRSLDLYLSKLSPKCNSFFQQPLLFPKENVWYAAQPIGKNKICAWMGHLSTSAGLSKRYTNHCIRATVATGLKHKGVDLLSIMSVTGHRNVKSLDSYIQAPSDSDRRRISSALQNLGQNDESPLTSVTSVPSNTDYTHDVSFSSAQTLNVTRNPLSAMNMFQNATISGGNITFNLIQQQ